MTCASEWDRLIWNAFFRAISFRMKILWEEYYAQNYFIWISWRLIEQYLHTLKERMESFWPKKLSHWILRINLNWLSISSQFELTLNIESTWIESQYRVNLNWLSILSQFDSNLLQLLEIPGLILVPPVTQLFRSKRLHFFHPVKQLNVVIIFLQCIFICTRMRYVLEYSNGNCY